MWGTQVGWIGPLAVDTVPMQAGDVVGMWGMVLLAGVVFAIPFIALTAFAIYGPRILDAVFGVGTAVKRLLGFDDAQEAIEEAQQEVTTTTGPAAEALDAALQAQRDGEYDQARRQARRAQSLAGEREESG